MALLLLMAVAGCGTNPPVGPLPEGAIVPADASATPTTPSALKLNIFIDSSTVSPSNGRITIDEGRSVVLVTRTDHDVTLSVEGSGIDQKVFVGRLSTIVTTCSPAP